MPKLCLPGLMPRPIGGNGGNPHWLFARRPAPLTAPDHEIWTEVMERFLPGTGLAISSFAADRRDAWLMYQARTVRQQFGCATSVVFALENSTDGTPWDFAGP